uniref:(California timema) hypothetical protein n=1 Tax=Timema californicum TaxID=61474 RepID=A0A7R9JKW3_TIMCA|nr:unnamed protein product [Timema californicum]
MLLFWSDNSVHPGWSHLEPNLGRPLKDTVSRVQERQTPLQTRAQGCCLHTAFGARIRRTEFQRR